MLSKPKTNSMKRTFGYAAAPKYGIKVITSRNKGALGEEIASRGRDIL